MRFDHHREPKGLSDPEAVWYAGAELVGAVAEAFGRDGLIDRGSGRRVCVVQLTVPFRVVDLCGAHARALGLDQRIGTTTNWKLTQSWARALYEAWPDLVGIRWTGRQAGSENVVLTDRADLGSLRLLTDHDISDPAVWGHICVAAEHCKNIEIIG